uniref:Ubiquitin-like protein ATG12 n=1 Tax=Graphocephala atropunctata TaxID=36148 RepID=A0A1B6KBL1_9HEMI
MAEPKSPKRDTQEANTEETSESDVNSEKPPVVSESKPKSDKIDILLKATPNTPIMKKKKWSVDPDKKIGSVIDFIRKYLKLDPSEHLFLYVNQAFAPSPDQIVHNLYDSFATDGKLVLYYSLGQAWG